MHLPPSARNSAAIQIADHIRRNTIGYGAVATRVGQTAKHPEAAVVAIADMGKTDCTAKVAVYRDSIVYVSATGTHVSYPTHQRDFGRVICAFLRMERD